MQTQVELDIVSKSTLPQMDSVHNAGKGYNPIHELMRAMVLRAIEDFRSGGVFRQDALDYFYASDDDLEALDDNEYVLSFSFICKHLGMDPEKTRNSIIHSEHRISTRRRAA